MKIHQKVSQRSSRFCKHSPFPPWISHRVKARASICFPSLCLLLLWAELCPITSVMPPMWPAPTELRRPRQSFPAWGRVPETSTLPGVWFHSRPLVSLQFAFLYFHSLLLENGCQQHDNESALRSQDGHHYATNRILARKMESYVPST